MLSFPHGPEKGSRESPGRDDCFGLTQPAESLRKLSLGEKHGVGEERKIATKADRTSRMCPMPSYLQKLNYQQIPLVKREDKSKSAFHEISKKARVLHQEVSTQTSLPKPKTTDTSPVLESSHQVLELADSFGSPFLMISNQQKSPGRKVRLASSIKLSGYSSREISPNITRSFGSTQVRENFKIQGLSDGYGIKPTQIKDNPASKLCSDNRKQVAPLMRGQSKIQDRPLSNEPQHFHFNASFSQETPNLTSRSSPQSPQLPKHCKNSRPSPSFGDVCASPTDTESHHEVVMQPRRQLAAPSGGIIRVEKVFLSESSNSVSDLFLRREQLLPVGSFNSFLPSECHRDSFISKEQTVSIQKITVPKWFHEERASSFIPKSELSLDRGHVGGPHPVSALKHSRRPSLLK